jgi:hypothetical protein
VRRYLLISGLLVSVLASCSSDSIAGPSEMVAFARAKALWDSRTFASYTYEIRTFCFCPPEMTQWNRVVVQEGAVIAVEPVDLTSSYYPVNITSYFHPIDSVFARLHRAMTDGGFSSAYADIDAEYDAALGYPRHIVYHEAPYVADAGATIEIRSLSSFAADDYLALRRR